MVRFFDIRIGSEYFKKVDFNSIDKRVVSNYSNIKIPKELKEMSTKNLLHKLRSSFHNPYCNHTVYDYNILKAELSTRENIPSGKKQTREERRNKTLHSKKSKK